MLTFVVGPSRAGKSTLVKKTAGRFPSTAFVNLDHEIAQLGDQETAGLGGWEGRWQQSRAIFDRTGTDAKDVVIDVGAGSLQTPKAFHYFGQHVSDIILIWAPFEAILSRHPGRDPEDLRRLEFSDAHKTLYDAIDRRINTAELNVGNAARMLAEHLTNGSPKKR
jgi:shikimate kinase